MIVPLPVADITIAVDRLGGKRQTGSGPPVPGRAGWNAEEMENHGINFKNHFKLLAKHTEFMKEIWNHEKAGQNGDFVEFKDIICYPKPVQRPHPPIIFGGATPRAREAAPAFVGRFAAPLPRVA